MTPRELARAICRSHTIVTDGIIQASIEMAIRLAVSEAVMKERQDCILICEQVRDSPIECIDPPAEVVILQRIQDRPRTKQEGA